MRIRVVSAVVALVLLAPAFVHATSTDAQVRAQLGGLRVPFIANEGQVDARVAYHASTFAGTLFVTRDGQLVYSLPGRAAAPGRPAIAGWSLTETLVAGRARPIAQERATTHVSYFVGSDPSRWRSEVATYEQVDLGEVWPGVSVSLRAHGRSVEKIFTVHPGGAVDRIRVRVGGVRALTVDASGSLVARTALGDVTFTPPVAYQEHASGRRAVAVAYRRQGREYGVTVGDYDRTLPLVIDPLLQSTHLGGSAGDLGRALAINPITGDVYVAGETFSTNFPGTAGGAQPVKNPDGGNSDVFVARLSSTLSTLIQATYLGGGSLDNGLALAIRSSTGDVYVAGFTFSTNFPGTAGGAQPVHGAGVADGFVARLTGTLTTLIQATYLGGSGGDEAHALAIHPTTGDVYVGGATTSTNFPGRTGGAQPAFGGGSFDGFVARLPGTLTTLTQATYLGGSAVDVTYALAIHPATGAVYAAGVTSSTNFPGTLGGAQPAHGGAFDDGFVARLTGTLTTLSQATYLGGSGIDQANALAIHPVTGAVYVTGNTSSANFPGTTGGAQPVFGGGFFDTFVAQLTATLTALVQATYLGGSGPNEGASSVAIAPLTGDVYVAGYTDSANFPGTAGGAQSALDGPSDAFVARLTSTLTTLIQATYLGGSADDGGFAVAIHPTGEVYVAGNTDSTNFPGTAGGAQPAFGGAVDGFVARLTYGLALIDPPLAVPTLSQWAQIAIVALLIVSGLLALRRRFRQPPRRA